MGVYRDRMAKLSAMLPDLLAADFCDELATSMADLRKDLAATTKRVSAIEELLIQVDRRLTDCCDDSLRQQVASLRAEVESLKLKPAPVTG